jgi:hypothetical protein
MSHLAIEVDIVSSAQYDRLIGLGANSYGSCKNKTKLLSRMARERPEFT